MSSQDHLKNPSRILVTRTDRIGDLMVSTPVFKALRERFLSAWIAAVIFIENRELLEGNPYLDEVILYDKHGSEKGGWGNFCFAQKLRRKKFDVVIHLHATNRMHQVAFWAGIPSRIGWTRKSAWCLTQGFEDIKSEGQKHEAEYNFELLRPFGIEPPEKLETYLPLSANAENSLGELVAYLKIPCNKPWIVINPSSSCPSKMWPAARFSELINSLDRKYGAVILLTGGPKDAKLARKIIAETTAANCFELAGRLNLGTLGVLLKKAALLISNDSGPVHMASAVETPVISIFGRNQPGLSPTRWRPLGERSGFLWKDVGCSPCLAHNCRIHFLCLDVISVADVMNQTEILAGEVLRQETLPEIL